jgi:Outer membrane efflux protein
MGTLLKWRRVRSYLGWGLRLLLVLSATLDLTGCTRSFYRKAADAEVNDVLGEKDKYPLWGIEQYHVYPDARARFADPTNPDRPPMPPDDQAVWKATPHPQQPGHAGVAYVQGTGYLELIRSWDDENRTRRKDELVRLREEDEDGGKNGQKAPGKSGPEILPAPRAASKLPDDGLSGIQTVAYKAPEAAPPPAEPGKAAPEQLPVPRVESRATGLDRGKHPVQTFFDEPLNAETRGFLLNLDQSVELGVINSRTYQDFREQLYAAALPVTQGRFNFSAQWFATEDFVRQWAGPMSPVGDQNNWSANSSVGFTKLFSTGALLSFNFLNNTVWNLFSAHNTSSVSTIDLSFMQPFLAGGGKAVTLEPLTQAERTLFYSIRAYARFREQFYVNVANGNSLPPSLPAAAGGTTTNPISVLASLNIASTDVSGGFVSYLSTLFRECDLAADKKLVAELEKALRIYEGYQEGGQFSPLQVDQVRSTLLNGRNAVLTDQQFVNNALDQFKLVLGMPANTPLILDDELARPITAQYDRYYALIDESSAASKLIQKQEDAPPAQMRAFLNKLFTSDPLVRGTDFKKRFPERWKSVTGATREQLNARETRLRDERRRLLDRRTELETKGGALSAAEDARLTENQLELDLIALELGLREFETRPWEKLPGAAQKQTDRIRRFRQVAYAADSVLVFPRNERFQTITELWPELPNAPLEDLDLLTAEVELAQQEAVRFALSHRWDLMNARAQLVDAWRQVRVTANALMAVFNVTYDLTSVTPSNVAHPFAFSANGTNQTLSFQTQLPLTRLTQRNAYRSALLAYQSFRRQLMLQEDNIAVQVRFDVRQLQLFAANYRIQKQVVKSLYSQVENALELITAPVDPAALTASGTASAANAAALTSQYLSALSSLNSAQTTMYRIWLSYLSTRMQLYLDLESLRMDNRGVWLMQPAASGPADKSACQPGNPGMLPPPGHPTAAGQDAPAPLPVSLPTTTPAQLPPATPSIH